MTTADLSGRSISRYKVTAKLGEGGMGEVWRATDHQLRREVAIKVLPPAFTQDPERLARFEREAQLLAQLHHPNIASIFGLEESEGIRALVMELVEGPTLAERLAEGALPLEESLSIACQIAEALEEAHEKGIIHRDLKPQNVKVTADGRVKVLDFGLAKAFDPTGSASGPESASRLAASPTLTLGATSQGLILGTAGYMAPEQAKGAAVDKRADIWAFGVVLYEMLAGRRLFAGDSVPETLAGVLKGEIDLESLPPETPPAIRRLLRRCLERQLKDRLHDIADARLVLEDVREGRIESTEASSAPVARRRPVWPTAAATLAAGVVVTSLLYTLLGRTDTSLRPSPPVRAAIELPENLALGHGLALSPDGEQLALALGDTADEQQRLYLRRLDERELRPLAGTEGGEYLFWSPDGDAIGFFADGKLKRIDLPRGIVRSLCDAPQGRGGAWSPDGRIVFAPGASGPLMQVPAEGGATRPFTELAGEGEGHRLPQFLPDGRSILFYAQPAAGIDGAVYAFDPEIGEPTKVLDSDLMARFVPPGFLAYVEQGNLMMWRFDLERLALSGTPQPLASGLAVSRIRNYVNLAVGATGQLVYQEDYRSPGFHLLWADLGGGESPAWPEPLNDGIYHAQVSPEGGRVAVSSMSSSTGLNAVEVLDFGRGLRFPILPEAQATTSAAWAPDGESLALLAVLEGQVQLVSLAPRSGETPRLLASGRGVNHWPGSFTPDGRNLFVVRASNVDHRGDILLLALDDGTPPRPFLTGPHDEGGPSLSPDGRWVLYGSDVSGQGAAWVTEYPDATHRWQVTPELGGPAGWLGPDEIWWQDREGGVFGTRLRRAGNDLEVVDRRQLLGGRSLDLDSERLLDFSQARQRFLLNRAAGVYEEPAIVVVSDWRTLLGDPEKDP